MKVLFKAFSFTVVFMLMLSFTVPTSIYKVDTSTSKIKWTGKKVTGEHTGYISLHSGQFEWADKSIKGGEFKLSMKSITCTDIKDSVSNARLVKHLKGDDFFSAEKFPEATFVISSINLKKKRNYDVVGKLSIKGITQEIRFPALVIVNGNNLVARAKITVDRTKFDIKYKSKNYFESIGDKAIEDMFDLELDLKAVKHE